MASAPRTRSAIEWSPWATDAFARARSAPKPILLWISAAWSGGCREMSRTTYMDAAVIDALRDSFVAVRVDADERPDIAERYSLGGIPTTAFLAPDGTLLGGGTFVTAHRLREAMSRVLGAGGGDIRTSPASAATEPRERGNPDPESLVQMVLAAADPEHGGFGTAPKFSHPAAVRLAIDLGAAARDSGSPEIRSPLAVATRALDAIGWGGLSDPADGGFFEYCAGRDWTDPEPVKLLGTNARLLGLFLHGASTLGRERWKQRAAGIVEFLRRRLRRRDGAYRGFAGAEPSRVFTDVNALAVSALLDAARVLDDDALGREALESLEHVLLGAYHPGEGVAHYGGGVRGLLTDQVAMAAATLDAWEATGNVVYRMMAEELMHYTIRVMADEENGGFFDRDPAVAHGEPAQAVRPIKSFVLNCEAASVLQRLARATSEDQFATRALAALAAIAPAAASQGVLAAHYISAQRLCGRA